jgi:multiple sugar transport system permease protein
MSVATTVRTRRLATRTGLYLLLGLGALVVLLPFLWMLRTVVLPNSVLYKPGASGSIFPHTFTLEHLRNVWSGSPSGTHFYVYLFNSVVVTTIAVISNVIFCGLGGYALARGRFRGKSLIFGMIVVMLAIPLESRAIPLYVLVSHTPLVDTRLGTALPVLITSTGLFLMRQYVMSVPKEIDEAAYLDGCSTWRLYWTIIFPICRPALAVIGIFSAVTAWNDFLWPLIEVGTQSKQTLPLAIANLASIKEQLQGGEMLTASLLSLLPVLVLYLVLQRQFIAGITGGAVK